MFHFIIDQKHTLFKCFFQLLHPDAKPLCTCHTAPLYLVMLNKLRIKQQQEARIFSLLLCYDLFCISINFLLKLIPYIIFQRHEIHIMRIQCVTAKPGSFANRGNGYLDIQQCKFHICLTKHSFRTCSISIRAHFIFSFFSKSGHFRVLLYLFSHFASKVSIDFLARCHYNQGATRSQENHFYIGSHYCS